MQYYIYNTTTNTLYQHLMPYAAAAYLTSHTATYDESSRVLYVFGGIQPSDAFVELLLHVVSLFVEAVVI